MRAATRPRTRLRKRTRYWLKAKPTESRTNLRGCTGGSRSLARNGAGGSLRGSAKAMRRAPPMRGGLPNITLAHRAPPCPGCGSEFQENYSAARGEHEAVGRGIDQCRALLGLLHARARAAGAGQHSVALG